MKRRQFGVMFATATFSLGGVGSVAAEASDEDTEPLHIEDVSMTLGGVTTTVGSATFEFQDGTILFRAQDVSMKGKGRSLSVGRKRVVIQDADAETYAALRAALVKAYRGRSASPLLTALATTDFNGDSPLQVSLGPVDMDGKRVADKVTATGTVGNAVPEGTRDLLKGGASMSQVLALGPSRWNRVTVQRGKTEVAASDVVMELDGASVVITSPGGQANVSGRSFEFSGLKMNVLTPETIPAAHVEFASKSRQLARQGRLTLSALSSAAADAGVTVANTAKAVRSARFTLSLDEVTENGESVIADFETSGTLAELLAALRQKRRPDDVEEEPEKEEPEEEPEEPEEEEPEKEEPEEEPETAERIVEVTSTTGDFFDYSFRVTGTIEQMDPEPDTGMAVDEITEVDDGFRVDGAVGTGVDRFVVSGELVPIDVPDEVQIETVRIL